MGYQALYRTWRPQDFDALVGQQAVKQALANALTTGRIAHAYLFTGPRGTGKTSTARILAKALNCKVGPTAHPCGKCASCQRITEGTDLDVYEIDAASNRGIDQIKALRDQLAFSPVEGRYKIYIIDEVHMLSTEAFNALLKTLEEPPSHVIFILATTDPQKIPPTIHSRCQRFDFHRVTVEEITDHLAYVAEGSGIQVERAALRVIAIQAEGGMRDALSLLDQCGVMSTNVTVDTVRLVLGVVGREALRELVAAIGKGELGAALEKLNFLLEQGKDVGQVLTELAEYLRAVLLYKAVPEYEESYLTDSADNLGSVASLFGKDRLIAAEERLHKAIWEVKNTMRPRINAELCLFDLCREEGSTLAALAARVERLEAQLAEGGPVRERVVVKEVVKAVEAPVMQKSVVDGKLQSTAAVQAAEVSASVKEDVRQQPENSRPIVQQPRAQENSKPTVQQSRAQENNKPTVQMPEVKVQTSMPQSAVEPQAKDTVQTAATVNEAENDWPLGEEYWKKALQLLQDEKKIAIVSCARNGTIKSFAHNELVVVYKSDFFAQRMEKGDFHRAVTDALLRVSRRDITLTCLGPGSGKSEEQKNNLAAAILNKDNSPVNLQNVPDNLRRAQALMGGKITNKK